MHATKVIYLAFVFLLLFVAALQRSNPQRFLWDKLGGAVTKLKALEYVEFSVGANNHRKVFQVSEGLELIWQVFRASEGW